MLSTESHASPQEATVSRSHTIPVRNIHPIFKVSLNIVTHEESWSYPTPLMHITSIDNGDVPDALPHMEMLGLNWTGHYIWGQARL